MLLLHNMMHLGKHRLFYLKNKSMQKQSNNLINIVNFKFKSWAKQINLTGTKRAQSYKTFRRFLGA